MSDEPLNALYNALAAAQAEIKNPEKTRTADTGKYKYAYADIGDVLAAVLPVFAKHGLSVMQPTRISEGAIILVTRIAHKAGGVIESEYPVCSLNGNHQAMGSAMTYARRYALTSLIGIAAVDDTDGEGAAEVGEGPRIKMTANQAKTELNWDAIQSAIDTAKDFAALDKLADRADERKSFWPDTYYHKAKERITFNRLQMAEEKLSKAKDIDDLADSFTRIETALEKKVQHDDLAAIYRKYESKLEDATFPGDRTNGHANILAGG